MFIPEQRSILEAIIFQIHIFILFFTNKIRDLNFSLLRTEKLLVSINGKTILKFGILRLKVRKFTIYFEKFIWSILT